MKLKHCFTLTVILIIMFSLSAVVADENITDVTHSDDSLKIDAVNDIDNDKLGDNENEMNDDSPVTDEKKNNLTLSLYAERNMITNDCYWNLTATLDNGTAYNTTILQTFSDNVAYISHNVTLGTYDPVSGIWDLGNLTSSDKASLRIFTKLTDNKTFSSRTFLKTDSKDVYFNPIVIPEIIPVYYTEKTDDKNGPEHDDHTNSYTNSYVIRLDDNPAENNTESDPPDSEKESEPDENPNNPTDSSSNNNPKSDSSSESNSMDGSRHNSIMKTVFNENNFELIAKATKSLSNGLSKGFQSLAKSIGNILNPIGSNDNNSDLNITDDVIKAIPSYDYTRIPILIFTAFIILLLGLVAYDKVKG